MYKYFVCVLTLKVGPWLVSFVHPYPLNTNNNAHTHIHATKLLWFLLVKNCSCTSGRYIQSKFYVFSLMHSYSWRALQLYLYSLIAYRRHFPFVDIDNKTSTEGDQYVTMIMIIMAHHDVVSDNKPTTPPPLLYVLIITLKFLSCSRK